MNTGLGFSGFDLNVLTIRLGLTLNEIGFVENCFGLLRTQVGLIDSIWMQVCFQLGARLIRFGFNWAQLGLV